MSHEAHGETDKEERAKEASKGDESEGSAAVGSGLLTYQ
jgi:hypothetical protein